MKANPSSTLYPELEIGLSRLAAEAYQVELRFNDPASDAEVAAERGSAALDLAELLTLQQPPAIERFRLAAGGEGEVQHRIAARGDVDRRREAGEDAERVVVSALAPDHGFEELGLGGRRVSAGIQASGRLRTVPVSSVAFAGEGLLVSADDSGRLIFWDPSARKEIGRMQLGDQVNGLAASPDGRSLAAAASDGTVYLFDLDWKAVARNLTGRGLTDQECRDWIHFDPKPPSCAGKR